MGFIMLESNKELVMTTCLIEELKKIEDFRISEGRRHPLWIVLLIVIMGTMSGYLGYRALGDFVTRRSINYYFKSPQKTLTQLLNNT
jgi:hypothetical protein